MRRHRTLRVAALAGLGMLSAALVGCGADEPAEGAAAGAVDGTAAEAAGLPPVSVLDVAAGDEVVLSSYLPADRPVLVWMWSPY
jgi:hypothetical protein